MKNLNSRAQLATHESRELYRIRSSFSFRLAVLMVSAFKNPLKFFILPFTIPRELFFRKSKIPQPMEAKSNSIVLVGIDTRGTMWSERTVKLAIELQRFDSGLQISLLTTSDIILKDRVGKLLHYRIPRPRSMDSSRRDWNLTCERLLSPIIHLQEASRIVFLGDYLYSGICHSVNSSSPNIHLHWMNSGENKMGLEKVLISHSTSVFEESFVSVSDSSNLSESTIQDHLNLRLDQTILAHLQLSSAGLNLWEVNLEKALKENSYRQSILTASLKKYPFLSDTLDIPGHIEPFTTPGFHFRIIDDDPEFITRIYQDRTPALILRTERELNKVTLKILEELERFGAAIVLRKSNLHTLVDAIETLTDTESRKRMALNRSKTSSEVSQEVSWAASMHSLIIGD